MSKTFSVFISYSRHDIDVARELQTFLTSKGYTVWIDLAGIQGGQDYMQRIHLAIMDSQAMVLLISKDSQNSEWVLKELTLAIKNRKQVVPVLIDGYGITNPSFDLALANINILDAARDMPEACLQIAESLSGGGTRHAHKNKKTEDGSPCGNGVSCLSDAWADDSFCGPSQIRLTVADDLPPHPDCNGNATPHPRTDRNHDSFPNSYTDHNRFIN